MKMTDEQEARLAHMQAFMKRSELYVHHWIAQATTGVATQRNLVRGDGHKYTPEELTKIALDTALSHIHTMDEVANNILLLMTGRETEIEG